jgi:low affinity Fe/Cu permease
MFGDSQTTLNIVLAIAVSLLTVFLCVTLIYLILILRDVNKMLEKIRETVDRVNNFILKPVSLASTIVDHVRPMIEAALERRAEASEREHKKKK